MALIVKDDIDLTAKHRAFGFQVQAIDAIKKLEYGAVFHEQGLGKTKIAIDIIIHWLFSKNIDSVIIVTKKGLVPNWLREFQQHTNIRPRVLDQNRKNNFAAFNSPARVYLTHYEVLTSEKSRISLFQKTRKVGIMLDESQRIKNPNTKLTKTVLDLSSGFNKRLILTGTPIANRPFDIWSQIYFLDHGKSLGDNFNNFKSNLDLNKSLADDTELQNRFENELAKIFPTISSFSVRETKNGANIELPKKEIKNIYCDWEDSQEETYKNIRDDMRTIVVREGLPTEDISEELMKRLLRLVQVASNPKIIDESYNKEPGKLPVLLNLVNKIISKGQKVIVWSSFTKNVDWLSQILKPFGSVKIHGKMAYVDRNKSCLSGYHPHPLYVVCLLGLQARAGAGALRRRSG